MVFISASANVPVVPNTDQTPDSETPGAQMSVRMCSVGAPGTVREEPKAPKHTATYWRLTEKRVRNLQANSKSTGLQKKFLKIVFEMF